MKAVGHLGLSKSTRRGVRGVPAAVTSSHPFVTWRPPEGLLGREAELIRDGADPVTHLLL
jgi:hypothetical protein